MNPKVLWDLKFKKSLHVCDSIMSVPLLDHPRVKYSISIEFNLKFLDSVNIHLISHQGLFACFVTPLRWDFIFPFI